MPRTTSYTETSATIPRNRAERRTRRKRAIGPTPTDTYRTVSYLAQRYAIGRGTIYRLARSKILPFVRIGRSLRFSESDVEAALSRK